MGKDSEFKSERILSIYSRLRQGQVINKEKESLEYQVSARTIQRDIADIQCFLQNQTSGTGEKQEVVFDKKQGGYVLFSKSDHQLDGREILAVAKVLLESRSLMKSELFPIIQKLINTCGNDTEAKLIHDMLRNEMYHYVELRHGKKLLDSIWQLEQAVKTQRYIEIEYRRLKNNETVKRKVKPVGIMFSEFYFYLTAYIEDIDRQEHFQNPDDTYPTIYRIDRLCNIHVLEESFSIPYVERFEEGEFRKRVQFMYGGKLKKVKFVCEEKSLEAILDRFPSSNILEKVDEKYIVHSEVFGNGIDLWLKGQEGIELI